MVLNPVKAKAVEHPREWAWGSYRATSGLALAHSFPNSQYGGFGAILYL